MQFFLKVGDSSKAEVHVVVFLTKIKLNDESVNAHVTDYSTTRELRRQRL